MTSTIRCIVLLTACSLWSACEDTRPGEATRAEAAPEAPKPAPLLPSEPALIATAPEPLKTIEAAPAITHALEPAAPENFDRPVSARDVRVERFVLAHGVKGREPVEESDSFRADEKIWAFVQLANDAAPFAFRVHWESVDGPSVPYGVQLNVPTAPRFRTWSWTAIEREPGIYRAVLRTLDGQEIASRELTITE